MKKRVDVGNYIYPMPVGVIGANRPDGEPTFMVAAFICPLNTQPPILAVSTGKDHFTCGCIERIGALSVNIPSRSLIEAVDYAGSVSGEDTDKSKLFKVSYGELGTVPMIDACPISLEVRVDTQLEYDYHVVYIGEIVGAHVDDDVLVDGLPDMGLVDPLVYSANDFSYYALGERLGKVWSMGPTYSPPKEGV